MTRTRPPQPQVSVIVPVYNQEQYLEECISSIRRQTLAEWECLIINDGSSDSSGEIARRFSEEDSRIRCLEQGKQGRFLRPQSGHAARFRALFVFR